MSYANNEQVSENEFHKTIVEEEAIAISSDIQDTAKSNETFCDGGELAQMQSAEKHDDTRSLSTFSTLDEIEDDEDLPVDEIVERGWSDNDIITQQMRYTLNGIPFPEPEETNFGSVRIKNSSNVHLGNRTFYKGPVYVKQYIYANSTSINDNNAIPATGTHDQQSSSRPHEASTTETKVPTETAANENGIHLDSCTLESHDQQLPCQLYESETGKTKVSTETTVNENETHVESLDKEGACQLSVLKNKIRDFLLERRLVIILGFTAILLPLLSIKLYLLSTSISRDDTKSTTPQDSTTVTIVPTTHSPSTTLSTTQVTDPSTEKASTPTNDDGLHIITREEWGAQPPKKELEPFQMSPLPYLIISESRTENCFTKDDCSVRLRRIQSININLPIGIDIPYHFYIGGDGLIYEGRGWDVQGDITYNYNNKSIGISFIGDFKTKKPTDVQVNSTIYLIEYARTHNKIDQDFKLRGLRQVNNVSRIPNDNLYNIIKNWNHWECEREIKGDCKI